MGCAELRIGEAVDTRLGPAGQKSPRLRLLGLYGAVFVAKGSGHFITRTRGRLRVEPGMVMLLFPDEPHTYYPDTEWTTRWVVWGGPGAGRLEEAGYLSAEGPLVTDGLDALDRAHRELAGCLSDEDPTAVLKRMEIILKLISDLYTLGRHKEQEGTGTGPVAHAPAFIEGHYMEPPAVDALACRVHLSPIHFRREFRRRTGRTPLDYITGLRMTAAKRLLAQGRSIKETAAAVGYGDEFYFMRMFRKVTGGTAGAFARSLEKT
ncbi:MAG: AraC family transcriptional regulator [Planctomycetota bacterium]